MFLYDLIFAFFIALLISLIISVPFRKEGVFPGILFFFFIIFLGTWAGGAWITPFGPVWYNIYWLPFVISALLLAFLVLALTSARPHRIRVIRSKEEKEKEGAQIELGCFFWLFIIILLIAIFIRYF